MKNRIIAILLTFSAITCKAQLPVQAPDLPNSKQAAAALWQASTIPNGSTATTQTCTDSSLLLATTGFVKTCVTGGGGGSVSSVSVATANGVSGTVATPTTTPAITIILGSITPTSSLTSTFSGALGGGASLATANAFFLQEQSGSGFLDSTGPNGTTYGTFTLRCITSSGTIRTCLSGDGSGNWTATGNLSSNGGKITTSGTGPTYSANSLISQSSSGLSTIDSVGTGTSSPGTFDFRCVSSNASIVTNCLSSDSAGNWTMTGGLTATTGIFSGAITSGGIAVCLANGSNCSTYLGGALNTSSGQGSFTLLSGAGTGATGFGTGFDGSGNFSVSTGTSPAASSNIFTLTFTASRGHVSFCVITPENPAAAALSGTQQVYIPGASATTVTLNSGSTALAASTTYGWNFTCL